MISRKTRWAALLPLGGLLGAVLLFAMFDSAGLGAVEPSLAQSKIPEENLTEPSATMGGTLSATAVYTQYLPSIARSYEPHFPSIFGVQLYGSISDSTVAMSLLESGRAHWARWPLYWRLIEPTNRLPADYRWVDDESIRNADEANLELIVTIDSNPDWASDYGNAPIYDDKLWEFVEFMAALVERYDGDGYADAPGSPVVNYWELYNEPDGGVEFKAEYGIGYWGPFGDKYAQMLCAIYPAVKQANPQAQVVFGGIAYDFFIQSDGTGTFVREFLGDVLAAGGGDCFDIMNFHYYPPFESNWSPYGPGLSGKAAYLRQHYSLGDKPMMVTEAGWASDDYSVYQSSPQVQGRYVVQLFTQAKYANLQALTWWTWIDPGSGHGPFGLLTQDLVAKPAYTVFRDAALRIGTATMWGRLYSSNPQLEVYRFTSAQQEPFYVLWTKDGNSYQISLSLNNAQVTNMYGRVLYTVSDGSDGRIDGKIWVPAGPDPIYVESLP